MGTRKQVNRFNYEQLYEMLVLRSIGWSYPKIAAYYNKDHTTIIYHCQKYHVEVGTPLDEIHIPEFDQTQYWEVRVETMQDYKYKRLIEEPINRGKMSYADYLAEEKQRKAKSL